MFFWCYFIKKYYFIYFLKFEILKKLFIYLLGKNKIFFFYLFCIILCIFNAFDLYIFGKISSNLFFE